MRRRNLCERFCQESIAWNETAGTIRGLHITRPPATEAKLIRCVRGSVHDVIVDVRRSSPSFGRSFAVTLDDVTRATLYVPEGSAHGYQTLVDNTELHYAISTPYVSELADGVRWDDPSLNIVWPLPPGIVSPRDESLPSFSQLTSRLECGVARGGSHV